MPCPELLLDQKQQFTARWAGDGIAVRAHAFQVKLNRLADEVLHLIERFARCAKARQIGSVCAPPDVADFS